MKLLVHSALLLLVSFSALAQSGVDGLRAKWSEPVAPFQVVGNVYYVGAAGISAHIITTPEGLILLDSGTTLMAQQILEGIGTLGFSVEDLKILLSSHAHWDHVEGHAAIQRATGAKVMALAEDVEAIATGTDLSALGGDGWEPVEVERVLKHGDTVELGGTVLTAHHTPGHSQGCTTWTLETEEAGKTYGVVFVGGTSVNLGVRLLDNDKYPAIADDYARTFEVLKGLKPDVFISQHPFMYGMEEKRAAQAAGAETNPFVNPAEYATFVAEEERKFVTQLKREQARKD